MKDRGDDPDHLGELYGDLINAAISDIPSDMTVTMHLCRGNYKSTYMGSGATKPCRRSCLTESRCTAFSWNTTANVPAASSRCGCSPKIDGRARSRYHQDRTSSNPRMKSSAASTRPRNSFRSNSCACRRNAALPHRRGQCAGRGRTMGEAAHDHRNRRRGVGQKLTISAHSRPCLRGAGSSGIEQNNKRTGSPLSRGRAGR